MQILGKVMASLAVHQVAWHFEGLGLLMHEYCWLNLDQKKMGLGLGFFWI